MTCRNVVLLLIALAALPVAGSTQGANQPIARARVWATLEERDLVLEGTAWDPSTRSVLVGSLNKYKVVAIAEDGSVSDRVAGRSHGLASVCGIHVDTLRRTLWVASNARYDQPTDTTTSALFAFDVATGAFKARYDAPGGERNFLNDLTTAPDGTVYVTASRAGRVYRLRPNSRALEEFSAVGQLQLPNGITISADGAHLFVADRDHIQVVALATGDSWTLAVADSIDVAEIDGLAYAGSGLVGHIPGNPGRVVRYELDAQQRAIRGHYLFESNTPDVRTSTTGEVVGDEYVFIGNGQIDRMNAGTIDFATMQPIRMYRVSLLPEPGDRVVVALSARDSVVVLDGQTLERVRALPVGHAPHEIATHGTRAFVANTGESAISVLSLEGEPRVLATWSLPDSIRVHDVAVTRDGRSVWGAAGAKPTIVSIDAASGRLLRRYPLERTGSWMLETGGPAGAIVVAHLEGGALTLLDPMSGAQRVVPLRAGQIDAAPTRDTAFIWSVNLTDSTLTVIDAHTGNALGRQIVGNHPVRVIMTPDEKRALVVNEDPPTVIAFDVRTRARVGAVAVAAGPKVIALSADGRRAYVTHPDANALTMIDVASLTVLKTVELPGTPDGVAVSLSTSTQPR